jgi:hypothetical protein
MRLIDYDGTNPVICISVIREIGEIRSEAIAPGGAIGAIAGLIRLDRNFALHLRCIVETILALAQQASMKLKNKNQRIVFIIVYQFDRSVLCHECRSKAICPRSPSPYTPA